MGIFDGIISAGLDFVGGIMRNEEAEDAADKQMKFQENMSSTAHQREVKDLIAAGLNPMLSGKYGGATTPAGASYNPEKITGGLAQNLQTALIRSQIDKNAAETKAAEGHAAQANSAAMVNAATVPMVEAQTGNYIQSAATGHADQQLKGAQRDQAAAATDQLRQQKSLTEAEIKRVGAQIEEILAATNTQKAHEAVLRLEATLKRLEIPAAENFANQQGTWWMRNVRPYMIDVPRGASAAAAGAAVGRSLK